MQHNMNGQFSVDADDEINILDYWRVMVSHKRFIGGFVAAVTIAAMIISLILPKVYRAETVIIPVSSSGGGGLSSLTSQFGGLASLAGLSVGKDKTTTKIMAMLKSRTLAEDIIKKMNLMPVLFPDMWDAKKGRWKSGDSGAIPTMEDAVNAIKGRVVAKDDKKSNIIKISAEFRDPKLAARAANAYVEGLQRFINGKAFTQAKRNRIFIEAELAKNKRELLDAGKEINEFYKNNRVSSVKASVDVPLAVGASASSIAKMSQFASKLNSNISKMKSDSANSDEIETLLLKKAELEKKIADTKVVKNVPQQVYLTYLMMRRELLSKINAMLATHLEIAKIEESKEDLSFEVIDKAVPPIHRYKPKRTLIVIISFIMSIFMAIFIVFFMEYIRRMKEEYAAESSRTK